jgi:putative transposase
MKPKRYTEEQIISILKEHESGASVPDIARRHGVAENTVYRWKSKFGGMGVSEAKRLRQLEAENAKLKRLLGEAELDKAALKELVEGKW